MLSEKGIIRLSVIFGILFWSLLTLVDMIELFSIKNNIVSGMPAIVGQLFMALFTLSLITFYKYSIGKAESINFVDLLWRVFVTGLLATIISLGIEFIFSLFSNNKMGSNPLFINFLYHIILGVVLSFIISTFIVWKRLILYQKSKKLLLSWQVFEYALGAALIFDLFEFQFQEPTFYAVLSVLLVLGLYLSFNLKWIAYLNFKQKWKGILFIVLVIVYIWYFFKTLMFFAEKTPLIHDLLNSVFVLSIFAFILLYCVMSLLVILFNLPTTSVFEKKMEEAVNFQRLSQSIPAGESEEKVYEILLDSAQSAVYSDAAWLKIFDPNENIDITLTRHLDESLIPKIQEATSNSRFRKILNSELERNPVTQKISANLKDANFKSILLFPVIIKGEKIGTLALLKEVEDGFNKEMIGIIDTFVNQASISVENYRLLNEAISNERYKEELKIATKVQNSLLPQRLDQNEAFDIEAFTRAADEVGGDYYDTFQLDENRIALIIGDVSGKGTSAAFHMAQMKGIFHSLVQLDLDPKTFMTYANSALSRCLEKTSFITISYFIIDKSTKEITFSRAGHCPTLFYNKAADSTVYFKNKGLGLGILRNSNFHNYVQVNSFKFQPGDVILLYTDGVTEACNADKEDFGYDNLQASLVKYANRPPSEIRDGIINDLYEFCGRKSLGDDYTLLIVKFK